MNRVIFLVFALIISSFTPRIAAPGPDKCENTRRPFGPGELLHYKLYYNWTALWITAGTAEFTIENDKRGGENLWHIRCLGRSAPAFNKIYRVEDKYETYLEPQSGQPLEFERHVDEGGYTIDQHLKMDHKNETVWIDYLKRRGVVEKQDVVQSFPHCTQDLLSAIYYARGLDFSNKKAGDKFYLDVFIDGEIYNTALVFLGHENIKWNGKKYRCIKLSPQLISGDYFKEEDELLIYATDDENKVPLIMESKLSFGKVKAYLHHYEGLKTPIRPL